MKMCQVRMNLIFYLTNLSKKEYHRGLTLLNNLYINKVIRLSFLLTIHFY